MSKKKTEIDDRQLNIFALLKAEEPPAPGSMNITIRLRRLISLGIKKSGMDRIDICTAIYKLTDIEVPKSTLDGWSAESRAITSEAIDLNSNKRWGIPAEVLAAFCQVTGYWEPLFIVVESGNYKALKGKDVVRARMGLLKEEITKKTHELKGLEKMLFKS
jgi:hypothetical protein